jgi:hypothetical protein
MMGAVGDALFRAQEQKVPDRPIETVDRRRTQLFLSILILTNAVGNVALSHGLRPTRSTITTTVLDLHTLNVWTVMGVCVY